MEILVVIAVCLVFSFIFYLLFQKWERSEDESRNNSYVIESTAKYFMESITTISKTQMEELTKVQKVHFEQLEKQSSKQLQILEKQTKDFIHAIEVVAEAIKPTTIPVGPDLLDKERITNTIEKEEPQEKFLDEMDRLPLIDGIKGVRFEDNDEVFPVDIQ